MPPRLHQFYAIAFEENLALRQLAPVFPQAKISAHELYAPIEPEGGIFAFPFGAVVAYDVPPERREAELARLFRMGPKLTAQVIRESWLRVRQWSTTNESSTGFPPAPPASWSAWNVAERCRCAPARSFVSSARPFRLAARCSPYSICWISPTRRGTTRRWIAYTATCE